MLHACSGTITRRGLHLDVQRGHSQLCRTTATSTAAWGACGWCGFLHRALHVGFLGARPCVSCVPPQVRLFSVVSLRPTHESWAGTHQSLRDAPFHVWLWWQHFESPEHLSDTLSLPHSFKAAGLTGEFTVDVN